jgi:hypothetical protein
LAAQSLLPDGADAVRDVISEHIARKRGDKAFRERLQAVMAWDREILERLAAESWNHSSISPITC